MQVRDRILAEEGCKDAVTAVPQSDANRAWMTAQQERDIEQGKNIQASVPTNGAAAMKLASMARMEPRYERNLPKLCSFFAKGECNRGSHCPFRHEMPRDRNDPLSKQNTKDRFFGTNDPVAQKMIGRQKDRAEKRRAELKAMGGEGDERAVSTLYVRFADGDDNGSGGKNKRITEADLRDKFYAYGEISSVRMHADKGAFIEFTTARATEHAIASTHRSSVKGRKIVVNWARVPKRGAPGADPQRQTDSGGAIRPVAPPGGFQTNHSASASGFAPIRPAGGMASATTSATASPSLGVPRPGGSLGVPKPGGGVIRRAWATDGRDAAPKPYYPSADPGRLGSRAAPSQA